MKLNENQRQVAEELDKNMLLLASAGTGKTNTLSQRILNILEQGKARPEEIICLTFTNKACNEMQQRIELVVGNEGKKVKVRTVHGFCYEIMRWAAKQETDIPTDFNVFDETDCEEIIKGNSFCKSTQEKKLQALINLVKEHRGEYGMFSSDRKADYDSVLIRLKEEKQQRLLDAAKGDERLLMVFEAHCGEIINEYDNTMSENHGVDFCDLINGAYQVLQNDEYVRFWQNQFRFWCVDEAQDTSRLEYKVLSRMFGNSNILMCGDFFQAIYEWRGSEPKLIYDKFSYDYHPEYKAFYENYRSTRTLLNASYGYLKRRFEADVAGLYKKDAVAVSSEEGSKIVCKKFFADSAGLSTYQEASWIYNELQRLKPKDLSRVCILTRQNRYNQELSKFFTRIKERRLVQYQNGERREQDFPLDFMLVEEFKFFRRQEIKDVVAALRFIINPQDNNSLVRILKRFANGIGPATLAQIQSDEYKEQGIRLTDFLHVSTEKYAEPFEMLLRALEEGNVVVFDVESTGVDTARDEIIQVAAIKIDIHGNILDKLMHYVKAGKSVGSSEAVHHISDAMLQEKGLEPEEALQKFLDFAKGSVIVGHNVVYDLTILSSELTRLGMPQLEMQAFYDTLDIFRRFYPKLPNHKLEFLGEYCKVGHKSTHDAFDDICATAEILIYAVENNIMPTRDNRRRLVTKHAKNFIPVAKTLRELRERLSVERPYKLIGAAVVTLGMNLFYKNDEKRLENMRDLIKRAKALDKKELSSYDAMQAFLRLTALSNTELDLMLQEEPKIPIITVHQAKGAEFDVVFVAGLQEGIFPGKPAIINEKVDEEAKLFYVAITRAKEKLYLTSALNRRSSTTCRFINSIPEEYIQEE